MANERRYSEEEIAAILAGATDPERLPARAPDPTDRGLTLREILEIGDEVGIPTDLIERAARDLDRPAPAPVAEKHFMGVRVGVGRTVQLDRPLTDADWERFVLDLRSTFGARGKVDSFGGTREWRNGQLHAVIEPTSEGDRLSIRTQRTGSKEGLAISAIMAVFFVLAGLFGVTVNASNPMLIGAAAAGVWGFLRFGLTRWSDTRALQMDMVADRLVRSVSGGSLAAPDDTDGPRRDSSDPRGLPPGAAVLFTAAALWTAAGSPVPLSAQTTPTQIAAAGDVLDRIDALQRRLDPRERAYLLLPQGGEGKEEAIIAAGEWWDREMRALSDHIGRNPEVGWKEFESVDTLAAVLRAHGFAVEVGVAGLETAFKATWTSPAGPDGPTLGLIGEYDALRDSDGPFHGDQHNAQTPVALSAALALRDYMARAEVPGRIHVFGTPAEEVGPPAKTIMLDAGVFEGTDILVRSHSAVSTSRARAGFGVCCLNIDEVKYTFTGRPAHQLTSWNGRNALEAAVRFYTSVDGLRSTFRPEASIQGVIPEGGVAPNVVPARAVVDYYIRYPDEVYLEHITSMMADAARGAALATGTKVEIDRYGEYRDGITLGTLEELYFAYAEELEAPALDTVLQRPAGYEETGYLTRAIPGVGVSVASSRATYHTKGMEADGLSTYGHDGFRMDAQIMAAVLFDFLVDPELRAAVAGEHAVLQGLLGEYHARLREAYAPELSAR